MPNWFYTTVTINGPQDALDRLRAAHFRPGFEDGDQHLDFETIIPMPAILEGSESGSAINDGLYVLGRLDLIPDGWLSNYLDFQWIKEAGITTEEEVKAELLRRIPDCAERAKKAIALHEATGYLSWHEWHCANWGTTHSSRFANITPDDPPGRLSFYMATAWAPPQPVFEKLAQLYPECTFEAEGLDEMDYEATEPSYRWSSRQADAA